MAQKYINKLHRYRSYSYHHILFVCDSSAAAESVAKSTRFSEFVKGNKFRTFRGRDSDQPLRTANGGQYLVLINGVTDVDFFIESANWYSILMPRSGSGIPTFAMASEGEIKIVEPKGARFFNILDKAFDILQSDPPGLIFMLKTFFIGYTDTRGGSEIISDIKPFMLIPSDIISVFDHAGGSYTLRFMAAYNGAVKAPAISKNMQVNAGGKETIANALADLESKLNKKSAETFKRITDTGIKGRPVKYVIITDNVYGKPSSPNADPKSKFRSTNSEAGITSAAKDYVLDNVKSRFTNDGKKKKSPVVSFGPSESVEQMIDTIMKQSKRAIQEATGKKEQKETTGNKTKTNNPPEKDKKKKIWKIYNIVDSDSNEFRAVYYVKQFELEEQTDADIFSGAPKNNAVEFDYIFSGNNVDIIEFDMKMELGLGFLQLLTNTSDSIPSGPEESNDPTKTGRPSRFLANSDNLIVSTSLKPSRVQRAKTPLPVGTNIRGSTLRNTADSDSMGAFQALLSRWAGYESIEAKMKIHGNPVFLGELSKFPSDVLNKLFPDSGTTLEPNSGEDQFFPSWQSKPSLVKVNVFMPGPETGAIEQFWYQGYYYLFGVNNVFAMGEFTQELDLVALPPSMEPPKKSEPSKPSNPVPPTQLGV